MILLVLIILVVCFSGWLVTGVVEGYMDAQKRPKEEMEWCSKHGMFRRKHILQFGDFTVCPRCYQEAFYKAENQ